MPKKQSKKEKKKALEEKRKAEAEALRIQQELEMKKQQELQQQRLEEQRKLKELKEKLKNEEIIRLIKENELDKIKNDERINDIKKLKYEEYEQNEWSKHLKCSKYPDLMNIKILNNFINEWENNIERSQFNIELNDVKYVINDVNYGYKLLYMVKDLIFENIQNRYIDDINDSINKLKYIMNIGNDKINYIINKCIYYYTCNDNENILKYMDINNDNIKFGFILCDYVSNVDTNINFKLNDINIQIDFPKFILQQFNGKPFCMHIIKRNNQFIYENSDDNYECYGIILDINVYLLPSKPKIKDGWRYLNISNELKYSKPFELKSDIQKENIKDSNDDETSNGNDEESDDTKKDDNVDMLSSLVDDKEKEKLEQKRIEEEYKKKRAKSKHISVKLKIDDHICIKDNKVKLGFYDTNTNKWDTNCFNNDEMKYNISNRELTFETNKLGIISLIQPKGIYYTYKSWELKPEHVGVERCILALNNENGFNIEIQIASLQCQLTKPNLPEFKHIYKKFMKPNQLIRALKDCGINLCYKFNDNTPSFLLNKDSNVVHKVHNHISIVGALFELSPSKFNKKIDNNHIIFNIRKPSIQNDEDMIDESNESNKNKNNEKWMMICCNKDKFFIMDCNEDDNEMNLELNQKDLSHTTLLRCLKPYCNDDFIDDLESTSFRFQQTIYRILNLVNIFNI